MQRILVAGVGNVLRGDDGFGPAVVERLSGALPAGVKLVETGIGGLELLHELMDGCDGLVLVDAVERGGEPGTVFEITPEVGEAVVVQGVHLANPERVLNMAKGLGVLPGSVAIVGCALAETGKLWTGVTEVIEPAVTVA